MKDNIPDIFDLIPHKNKFIITDKEFYDYINNLKQENEKLQQIYTDEYNLRHKLSFELSIEKDKNIQLKDYKSRVEKAIKKVKALYSYADNEEYVDNYCKDLLNILEGGKDERD